MELMHQRLQVFVDLCQFLHLLRIFRLNLKHLLQFIRFHIFRDWGLLTLLFVLRMA